MVTLTNAKDVKAYGLLGEHINEGQISKHINAAEKMVARKILGMEFYELLVSDVIADDLSAETYDQLSAYDTGDIVDYYGQTWESETDNNTELPGGTGWTESNRFNTPEYESFWVEYLRPYMTAAISVHVFPYLQPVGSVGMIQYADDTGGTDGQTASRDAQAYRLGEMKSTASALLRSLIWHIYKTKEIDKADTYDKTLFVCCPGQFQNVSSRQTRRWNLRGSQTNMALSIRRSVLQTYNV